MRLAARLLLLLPGLLGADYYAAPKPENGTGTQDDPYGIRQLITADGKPGVALDAMRQGDTLFLGGGTYDFATEANPSSSYQYGILAPAATDCTIRSKPGEKAIVRRTAGLCPLAGPMRRNGFLAHRTRWIGIEFVEGIDPGVNPALVRIVGTPAVPVEDCEVTWCRIIGSDVSSLPKPDNHECLRADYTHRLWAHHNELRGMRGVGKNSAGYKEYGCTENIFEDNYVHDNNCGIYLKNNPRRAAVRRNLCIGNNFGSTLQDFVGTEFTGCGEVEISDNIMDSCLHLGNLGITYSIHHNLIRNHNVLIRHTHDTSYSNRSWNNILLSPTNACNPYWSGYTAYPGSPVALLECDYNLVASQTGDAPSATYPYKGQNFSLAQFRALGFEVHSQFPSGGPAAIFANPATYTLKPAYLTAGRDGDIIGPRDPAMILDTSRYGPEALIEIESTLLLGRTAPYRSELPNNAFGGRYRKHGTEAQHTLGAVRGDAQSHDHRLAGVLHAVDQNDGK